MEYQFAVECKRCLKRWQVRLSLTGERVEVFASICDCGEILVGNYAVQSQLKGEGTKIVASQISEDPQHLSNGAFKFLDTTPEELSKLPILELE